MKTLTAILFVGGESRRMGIDKATLILNGESLWFRQLRILRELCPTKIVISARSKPAWCPADIEAILDEPPSRGPLSGLAVALGKIQTTHLLALAIDLPNMTPEHLKKLWSLAQPGIGTISQNGELYEPLCTIYPIEGLGVAKKALGGNDVSLHGFIQTLTDRNQLRFHKTLKSDCDIYQNVNTPGDWTHHLNAWESK